jgi:hypothetical protein
MATAGSQGRRSNKCGAEYTIGENLCIRPFARCNAA